jgi:hypothetical protein
MNSNFIQRDGDRLYGTAKMSQQEYSAELLLNGSKPSIANPKRTFHASLAAGLVHYFGKGNEDEVD